MAPGLDAHGFSGETRRILCVMRWPVGGIRTYLHYNYPLIQESGYRFTFVGPNGQDFDRFASEVADWPEVETIAAPVHNRHCRLRPVVRPLLKSRRFALVHSQGVKAAVEVVLANLGIRVPHIMTSHGVFRPTDSQGLKASLQLRLLGQLLCQVETIIAVSEDARSNHLHYLPRLARHAERLITIKNGIRLDSFVKFGEDSQPFLRKRLGLDSGVVLLGFMGRFMDEKGFIPLLEALVDIKHDPAVLPFHLVGVGGGDYIREYRREVERRDLSSVVSLLEFVPDVGPILKQLDLLVVPSLWEACPLLPMEAMVSGVPVLGTDCIGLREVIAGSPSIMVPAGNSEALANGLREAIEKPRTSEACAYVPVARKRFDVRSSSEQLSLLFDKTILQRKRGC